MSRLLLSNGKKVEIPLDTGFPIDDDDYGFDIISGELEYTQDDEDEHLLEQWKIDQIPKRRQ